MQLQTKKLTPATAEVIKNLLNFIKQNLVYRIELEYAAIAAAHVIEKLKETADILADENLDNSAQLKEVWAGFVGDYEMVQAIRLALQDAISKINDEIVKEALTLLVDPLTKTLVALTDKETADGEQLEKIWIDFVTSEKFIDFVQKNLKLILSKFIKSELIVNLIVSLLDLVVKDND